MTDHTPDARRKVHPAIVALRPVLHPALKWPIIGWCWAVRCAGLAFAATAEIFLLASTACGRHIRMWRRISISIKERME